MLKTVGEFLSIAAFVAAVLVVAHAIGGGN